ncbi:hypothetical protein B9Z55_024709 [Caenorhabditis nigoni]|uniref:C2H2-type domain-containing protein n=1 Tax=Caenorhabditis nigoni TaxID=1611254 RepID=A0A2G5SV62_9PELO|nr:hypothetical protein B9Z55_024709 [Caenorhabditis nigoni]
MSVCVSPLVQPTTLMTELETLTCPQCPKSFTSTKMLQQHQQMFHTDKTRPLAPDPSILQFFSYSPSDDIFYSKTLYIFHRIAHSPSSLVSACLPVGQITLTAGFFIGSVLLCFCKKEKDREPDA